MKCSICKRDLGKGYNGKIYKVEGKYICEECADKIAEQGGYMKWIPHKEEVKQQDKEEVKQQNKDEVEKEKKKKEYDERMKELQEKYKDIL